MQVRRRTRNIASCRRLAEPAHSRNATRSERRRPSADACEGIAEAHALGVVHRDVKPSNVFLADAGLGVDPLWSMGVLLYELLAGDTPFGGKNHLSLFANVMTRAPLPLRSHIEEGVPPAVEAVILKCLRRPREERYQSRIVLARELRSVAAA